MDSATYVANVKFYSFFKIVTSSNRGKEGGTRSANVGELRPSHTYIKALRPPEHPVWKIGKDPVHPEFLHPIDILRMIDGEDVYLQARSSKLKSLPN